MKYKHNKYLLSLMVFILLFTSSSFARKPVTQLSNDAQSILENPIAVLQPITQGKGKLIGGFLGKVLNLPKTVKIPDTGFLVFALSAEAFQGEPAEKNGYHNKVVLPYLLKSKEMNDSLKLRKTARQIRYQALRPAIEKASELNAEQKKDVINFLSQSIGSPMVVMAKSPLPAFVPAPGPCMMPMGVEMVDPKTGKRFGLETSAICVLDIKSGGETLFSVKEALENDTLDLVLAHENAHGIQFDLYGKLFHKIQRTSTNGHDAPYITDLGMAYIEGWAEAFEAVYGPANPKLKEKDRKKYNISEFLYGRQDPIRRDRYVWANHVGKKTGTMKNGLQLMSTEGVVAGLYYDILTSRAINAPFEKCVQTMLTNPMDFVEFVKNFVQLFPEDKKVVYRILLENTNYVTLDKRAAEGYKNYYQYKLAYVQKKVSKQEYLKARDAYKNYTEALFKKAMAGADIFANVGPQMWFAGKVKLEKKTSSFKDSIAKKMGKDNDYWEFRMDLNTVTVKMLRNIGFAESDAAKIVEEREKLGFFTGNPVKVIEKLIGSERYPKYNAVFNFTNYDHKSADYVKDYVKQSIALWPEDIEKL